jgi:hypothetical protein
MIARLLKSRTTLLTALILMALGVLDPLEGAIVILVGVGLAALHARFINHLNRKMLYWVSAFVAIGIGAMVMLSVLGGIGGKSGRSLWWGLLILPYPIGWLMGLGFGIRMLFNEFKHPHEDHETREGNHV